MCIEQKYKRTETIQVHVFTDSNPKAKPKTFRPYPNLRSKCAAHTFLVNHASITMEDLCLK